MAKKRWYTFGGRMLGKAHAQRLEAEFRAAMLGQTVEIVSPEGTERFEPVPKQLPDGGAEEAAGEGAA